MRDRHRKELHNLKDRHLSKIKSHHAEAQLERQKHFQCHERASREHQTPTDPAADQIIETGQALSIDGAK